MPHTANRHGRTITINHIGYGRRAHFTIDTNLNRVGVVHRGTIRPAGIRDGRPVWQPVTFDHEWLDEVCGDFVDAERALLDATAEMDVPPTLAEMEALL